MICGRARSNFFLRFTATIFSYYARHFSCTLKVRKKCVNKTAKQFVDLKGKLALRVER